MMDFGKLSPSILFLFFFNNLQQQLGLCGINSHHPPFELESEEIAAGEETQVT